MTTPSEKSHTVTPNTHQHQRETEYSRMEAHALHLVGTEGHRVL